MTSMLSLIIVISFQNDMKTELFIQNEGWSESKRHTHAIISILFNYYYVLLIICYYSTLELTKYVKSVTQRMFPLPLKTDVTE